MPRSRPGQLGEVAFAEVLGKLPDEGLHLWFSLQLPGVSEIDALLIYEGLGAFTIEVKAVELPAIRRYHLNECVIEGRTSQRTPLMQANDGTISLVEYANAYGGLDLWLTPLAAWPLISRADWNRRWPDPQLVDQARSMLFREDLETMEALVERLRWAVVNPGIGPRPSRPNAPSRPVIEHVENLLRGRVAPLESSPRAPAQPGRGMASDVPVSEAARVELRGLPGTGKTHRLLHMAEQARAAGQLVLFTCFNKVLASDVRSRIADRTRSRQEGAIDVVDIFQLLSLQHLASDHGTSGLSHDEWALHVVSQLSPVSGANGGYDLVLLDEAQDLPDWTMDLILALAKPRCRIVTALGVGQALYREEPAEWVREFGETATRQQLRRSFRSTPASLLSAQAFWELAPDTQHLSDWSRWSALERQKPQTQLEFDVGVGLGEAPHLRRVELATAERGVVASGAWWDWREAILDELSLHGIPSPEKNVLVLVPSKNSDVAEGARSALRELEVRHGCGFVDLTDEARRRTDTASPAVRLCTFHSSRGIEAQRALVLGLDRLAAIPSSLPYPANVRNLGYVVLSRAFERTTVLLPSTATNDVVTFVDELTLEARHRARCARGDEPVARHQVFGLGIVLARTSEYAHVDFGRHRTRKILVNHLEFL